jgi:hypothetical protein
LVRIAFFVYGNGTADRLYLAVGFSCQPLTGVRPPNHTHSVRIRFPSFRKYPCQARLSPQSAGYGRTYSRSPSRGKLLRSENALDQDMIAFSF